MVLIVDNGIDAEDIAQLVRGSEVVLPSAARKQKASAYILTHGDEKHKKANIDIVQNSNVPVLGIGMGCAFLVEAFGSEVKKCGKVNGMQVLKMERPGPLVMDLKRNFTVFDCYTHKIEGLTENFDVIARSPKYDYEIIMDIENPFFGVHFAPHKGGDGIKVLQNFVKFIEIWEKYHKS